jgi:hypothetical protein
MTRLTLCALALLLSATLSYAEEKKDGISISFSSEDSRTEPGPRRDVRDARLAITTRDGSVTLLLMSDVLAVQLTDRALANLSTKEDANFLEELLASGVRVAMRKAVEYPTASIRSITIRDGALVLTNDKNQPVFTEIKVNGREVLRDFALADATHFMKAFAAAKSAQH